MCVKATHAWQFPPLPHAAYLISAQQGGRPTHHGQVLYTAIFGLATPGPWDGPAEFGMGMTYSIQSQRHSIQWAAVCLIISTQADFETLLTQRFHRWSCWHLDAFSLMSCHEVSIIAWLSSMPATKDNACLWGC